MISKSRLPLLYKAKAAIIAFIPIAAWGADSVSPSSVQSIAGVTWAFMCGFSMLGWAVSELDDLAELWNTEGKKQYEIWKERLKQLKGVAAANAAGITVYFLGTGAPGFFVRMIGIDTAQPVQLPEMALFVFVSGGGYMGVRWFAWLERKFFGGQQ